MWPIRFVHPVALAIVPLAAVAFLVWRRRLGGLCTLAAVVCLALAAAGPRWATHRQRIARLYAIDTSGSTFLDSAAALEAVRRSIGELHPEDRAGLIVFGASPLVALPPAVVQGIPDALTLPPEPPRLDATDIAAAIRLAVRQLGDESYDRQVVLLTDGRETEGQAAIEAALAADRGVRVFALAVGPVEIADARVSLLRAPAHVRLGEPFELTVELAATSDLEAKLTLARDGAALARPRTVAVERGAPRRIAVMDRLDEPGPHTYTARLVLADRCQQNNYADAVVRAEGSTRVLYLSTGSGSPLAGLLSQIEALDVEVLDPATAPLDRAALASADCVVLDNVRAAAIEPPLQQAIRDWVRDASGGLIALGGPASYGPGGYADTPVEEALPVLCSRPKSVALLVALDKSGSMGDRAAGRMKIAFARDAILRALGHLRAADSFGLLVFDSAPEVLLPLGRVPSIDRLARLLDAVEPHGPTEIQLTLERAVELLTRATAEVRHVVLVSDGQVTRLDTTALRERYRKAEVTLSVIMTGEDPKAVARLRELAGRGFYFVSEMPDLSRVFRKALDEATYKRFLREGEFAVQRATGAELLTRGVALAGPLAGYVRTVAKPRATTEWNTGEPPDPILARWRFGLGRAAAFASTVGTRWDKRLWGAAAQSKLWQQVVRWAARPPRTPGFEAEITEQADRLVATVRAEKGGRFLNGLRLAGRVAPPTGESFDVDFPQTAPGEYRAEFRAPRRGVYHLTVVEEGKGQRLSLSVAKNYAREWEAFGVDRASLEAIARNGRGKLLRSLDELRDVAPRHAAGYVDVGWAPTAAGLVLFVAAVFLHVVRSKRVRM